MLSFRNEIDRVYSSRTKLQGVNNRHITLFNLTILNS